MSESRLAPRPADDDRTGGMLADVARSRIAADRSPATQLSVRAFGRPDGRRDRSSSAGDRGDGAAPDAETVFRIASVTKSFTAARALQLRDAGILDLDRPLSELLPGAVFRPFDAATRITPRLLLTMSAGLPTDDAWADRLESMPSVEFDAMLTAGIRLVREPGTGYEYANLGWAVLGRIMEDLDGRPLPEQIETELLDPLGLRGVRFSAPQGRALAIGFARRAAGWQPQPLTGPGSFSAIGGLFASATDLLAWAAWLASAFANPDDDRVLSAASRREMQRLHREIPSAPDASDPSSGTVTGYGYGLVVEHSPTLGHVVSHSGGYPGFSAHLRWSPTRRLAVCGLENAGYSGIYTAVPQLFSELLAGAPGTVDPSDRLPAADPEPMVDAASAAGPGPAAYPVWPETVAAAELARTLFARIEDDALWNAAERNAFAACLALDSPIAERREHLSRIAAELGRGFGLGPEGVRFPTPATARWRMIGPGRQFEFRLEMTPTASPEIQRFDAAVSD